MTKKLEPADPRQCQAEVVTRTPWALGGTHRRERCQNQPAFIATENAPWADGQYGSMSLCPECAEEMKKQLGVGFATLTTIKAVAA